ncbi:RNA-binding protein [Amaricoccus solimangrovi]|uniref:RNA-binding protein n=1 Tax=Amaricoccus solimangrovi TaxID=2589815 RepID=A0A501X0W5_9RHOB|nr:RNA-binding protein [Amaricoccus solimangrovi]TPE52746.1 RNA-binding protein [Amaricoccus solimangrovi]
MTRGGRVKTRDEPERRCLVTRETGPKAGLIRFVVGPDDEIVPDLAEKLPGRGLWVTAEAAVLAQAVKRGAFSRGAKRPVKAPPDLVARVEAMLAGRVVDLIALARKAGEGIAGFEKVKAALVADEVALLIQAADGSARGRSELRPPDGAESLVSCLSGHELGLAFGRDSVIHAAVLRGGLSERIRIEASRLAGFRAAGAGADSAAADGEDSVSMD